MLRKTADGSKACSNKERALETSSQRSIAVRYNNFLVVTRTQDTDQPSKDDIGPRSFVKPFQVVPGRHSQPLWSFFGAQGVLVAFSGNRLCQTPQGHVRGLEKLRAIRGAEYRLHETCRQSKSSLRSPVRRICEKNVACLSEEPTHKDKEKFSKVTQTATQSSHLLLCTEMVGVRKNGF